MQVPTKEAAISVPEYSPSTLRQTYQRLSPATLSRCQNQRRKGKVSS